jgi:hypothetical protein
VEEERAEGSSSSDDSDESESGVNAVEQAREKKRRLPPRARSKPSYTEKDSEEGDYSESYGEDESEGSDNEVSCEEDSHTKRERVISHKKRKRVSGLAFAPVSKRGRTLQEKKSEYPDLEKWQPVSKRLINSMGVAVLGKLVSLRLRNIFMMPNRSFHQLFHVHTERVGSSRFVLSTCVRSISRYCQRIFEGGEKADGFSHNRGGTHASVS